MAALPTVSDLIKDNPDLDLAAYGVELLVKAPPTQRYLDYEAKMRRQRAQPHYVLKGRRFTTLGSLWQIAEYLNHPSPKVQDRARTLLMEIASRAQALAEAGDNLEEVMQDLMDRTRELMP